MGGGGSPRSGAKCEWDIDAEEPPIEAESAAIQTRLKNLPELFKQGPISFGYESDEDEEPDECDILHALANIIDLTDDTLIRQHQSEIQPPCNPPSPSVLPKLRCYFNGSRIEQGSTVEMRALEQPRLFKASFLYVNHIFSTPRGIQLRGVPLTRLRNLRGRLPRLRNEVAMILHVDSNDKRPEEVQSTIEIPITDVIKIRNCHFTNADFPQHRTVLGVYGTIADLEEQGVLMCRWKCVFIYRDSTTRIAHVNQTRKNAAPLECIVEHLNAKNVSKKRFKVPETGRFNIWRGGKVRGGEHEPEVGNNSVEGPVIQLDSGEDSELVLIEKKPGQRYTFGDMFCGAGGASCGARKAGFQVKVACDNHSGACNTYAKVFPEALLRILDIFEFITSEDSKLRVDVLHLSPPCQFWSPAHTCAGVNDDANIAVLFSCRELIKKLRPRLFTLEQTYGILDPRFEYYFNALIHGFTENNYSEKNSPPFPKATHIAPDIEKRGGKPYATVKKMLARIPRDATQYDEMHQPQDMVRKRLERWDPDVTLKRCITTNGGVGNYHPNGRRDFTLREYAMLQTFPVDYPFQNPERKKQIGNAFPPLVVKVLYTHLRQWLENKDCVYAVENEPIDPDDPDIEILDLEDDGLMDETSDDEGIEYVGSQQLSSSSSDCRSGCQDAMDLDASDGDYGPVPCVDANQRQHRRGWMGETQEYIDLTADD
ncbi:hypothetical protein NUW58_g2386 [Xylaria curta]|uniref:Uncharacterized protein n=1 Tax=Xylaria curta TaxID=42375 RepID=A0ACC1PFT4_9PEZI|nr:hypothetical protein NUW58_g2386 [Xylaria curta]